MASKHDIGWEHAEPVGGNRRTTKCKYCGKVIHGSIIRLKQHIAHIFGQVEGCRSVLAEVSQSFRLYMSNVSNEKIRMKKKKEHYKFFMKNILMKLMRPILMKLRK